MKITTPIICYGGTVHAHYMQGRLGLVNQCAAKGISTDYPLIYFESLISRARNASAAAALHNKSDYLFFIDTDVVFNPKDFFKLLPKLINSDISNDPFLKLEYIKYPTLSEI